MDVPTKLSRIVTLLIAAGLLCLALLTVRLLISRRPAPQERTAVERVVPDVSTLTLKRGSHPIRVELFGTAQAEQRYSLYAPYGGSVTPRKNYVAGDFVAEGEVLFDMETTKLSLMTGQLEAQLQQLILDDERLQEEEAYFRARLETLAELIALNERAVERESERRRNEEEVYSSKAELRKRETISQTSFLQAKSNYNQFELNLVNAKLSLENNKERRYILQQELMRKQIERRNLPHQARDLQLQMADLLNDRSKASVAVEGAARVIEVMVDAKQEVTPGRELATLRSTGRVLIPVTLPDIHFRWLYEGGLLEGEQPKIEITMVNRELDLPFEGGSIRSIGGNFDATTRSLPITIQRDNPADEKGRPIPEKELRPGAYCAVSLNLCELPNTYYIPPNALQDGERLFTVKDGLLHIVEGVEILHENGTGMVIRLPEDSAELEVVIHSMRRAEEGMQVHVEATQ